MFLWELKQILSRVCRWLFHSALFRFRKLSSPGMINGECGLDFFSYFLINWCEKLISLFFPFLIPFLTAPHGYDMELSIIAVFQIVV